MKLPAFVTLLYGLVVLIGGITGYFMAESTFSLLAGLMFGILILNSSRRIFKQVDKAHVLALFQSVVLGAFFIYRYTKTHMFFPAGILIILSALTAVTLLLTFPKKTVTPTSQ